MPALTQPQWDAIRRVSAEAARRVVHRTLSYNPCNEVETQLLLDLGFQPTQVNEIVSIAKSTAAKTIKQQVVQERAADAAKIEKLQLDNGDLCNQVQTLQTELKTVKSDAKRAPLTVSVYGTSDLPQHGKNMAMIQQIADKMMAENRSLNLVFAESNPASASDYRGPFQPLGRTEHWNSQCAAQFVPPAFMTTPKTDGTNRPKPRHTPGAKEGDRCWSGQELFTFFRGQWRRRSELEGYASAAKYL
jgi:hypothetical protein